MRLTFRLMGLEVLVFEISTDADSSSPEPDPRDLSGGTLASTPMGFVASFERPQDIETPDRDY